MAIASCRTHSEVLSTCGIRRTGHGDYHRPKINKYLYTILPKRDAVLAEREAYPQEHDISIIGPAVEPMIHLLCNRSQRVQAGLEARRFDFLVSTNVRVLLISAKS